jgi:hypothetical protein
MDAVQTIIRTVRERKAWCEMTVEAGMFDAALAEQIHARMLPKMDDDRRVHMFISGVRILRGEEGRAG